MILQSIGQKKGAFPLYKFVFCACLGYCFSVVSSCCMSPRYDEIESKMTPFLKVSGYNVKKGIGTSSFILVYFIFFPFGF